ncbi:hypothetical protein [Ohtaekwangia koreensis]|uniref:Uncharacterized protein n=1 Tax=Ohtaekwangia koreensis TaxID=688867 RepID=A0A1T5J6L4_9BACT|nr:hypothetical protein [Ohtaekwangia koreensis]SKC47021.1 hypothetical protein SAMN05660236_0818 [Ohtaekwangia koreensis]
MSKQGNYKSRFIRWQGVLREHLTFTNNMILVTGIGIIASLVALLDSKDFIPTSCQKIFFTGGMLFDFISVTFGMAVAASRLQDFRETLRKIKSKGLEQSRNTDFYGNRTWWLFYLQFGFFAGGAILLTIAFGMIYQTKLF